MKITVGPPWLRVVIRCEEEELSRRLEASWGRAGGAATAEEDGLVLLVSSGAGAAEGRGAGYEWGKSIYRGWHDGGVGEYDSVRRRGWVVIQAAGISFCETFLRQVFLLECYRRGALAFHAAAAGRGEDAVMSCGPSGSGKSTLARLLAGSFEVYSDEIIAVADGATVWGLPFRGTGVDEVRAGGGRLAVVTVHRPGKEFGAERLSPEAAARALWANVFVPAAADAQLRAQAFRDVADLVVAVPVFEVTVPLDEEAAAAGFRRLFEAEGFERSGL